jgi:hypothetical protein
VQLNASYEQFHAQIEGKTTSQTNKENCSGKIVDGKCGGRRTFSLFERCRQIVFPPSSSSTLGSCI